MTSNRVSELVPAPTQPTRTSACSKCSAPRVKSSLAIGRNACVAGVLLLKWRRPGRERVANGNADERGLSPPARREAPPRRQCPLRASADVALGRQPAAPGSEPPRPRRQRRRDRPLRPRLPGRVVLVANRRCLWRSGRVPACARRRVELQLGRDPSAAVRSPTRWVFLGAAPALVCAVVNAGCEPPREGALIAALSGLLGDAGVSRPAAGLRFGRRCCALRVGHGRGACPWLRGSGRVARASSSLRRRSWARRSSLTRRSLREFLGLTGAGGSVRAR